ncbi:MAG: outer membrane lipoprotein carrier protein LolA [Bacteroidales bacterium]|nr:outer membrane lipoprotein carrier protein LolA [Bacteroidales bacterium]
MDKSLIFSIDKVSTPSHLRLNSVSTPSHLRWRTEVKRWRGAVATVVMLCLCLTMQAQSETFTGAQRSEVLTAIAAAQQPKPGKTLNYSFRQTKHSRLLAEDAVSKGNLTLGDRTMQWRYTEPNDFTLVVEGDSIYTVVGGKRSSFSGNADRMTRGLAQMMMQMTDGTSLADERVFETVLTEESSCYRALLTPKRRDMRRMMQQAELTFDRKSMCIKSVRLVEKDGYTQIDFTRQ